MAIVGRSLGEATADFRDHLNFLLHRTITQQPLSMVKARSDSGVDQMQLTFRDGIMPAAARLNSERCGELDLVVAQRCESRRLDSGKHRLVTVAYTYSVAAAGQGEAVFRWDYLKRWPYQVVEEETGQTPLQREKWSRHHLQGTTGVSLGHCETNLNDLHLPSGYVAIEDIIRFCLLDLGVPALCAEDEWHDLLNESYETFTASFVVDEQ